MNNPEFACQVASELWAAIQAADSGSEELLDLIDQAMNEWPMSLVDSCLDAAGYGDPLEVHLEYPGNQYWFGDRRPEPRRKAG